MLEKVTDLLLRLSAAIQTLPAKQNCMRSMSPDPNPLQRISWVNCPYPKDAGSGFNLACVEALERATSPPLALLLAAFCRTWRHFDPVYESMA